MREKLLSPCTKKLLILSLIVVFFGHLPRGVYAADGDSNQFWVRTDGNDSCNGQNNMSYSDNSTDCAWLSINTAASNLQAGQTVRVLSGTYNEQNIMFTNAGNSTDYITVQGSGLPNINGTDVIFNITKSYINLTGFNITGVTTKASGINNGTVLPTVNIYQSNNVVIQENYIYQTGLGGYKTSNPGGGGYTPTVHLTSSNDSLIKNNTLVSHNMRSAGILIESSTNNNITQNSIKARQYYSIYVKYSITLSDYNNSIDTSNTGLNGLPIYYYFGAQDVVLDGVSADQIYFANSTNMTLKNLFLNNSDGVTFAFTNDSEISNYTNIRSKVSSDESNGMEEVKITQVLPLLLFNANNNNIAGLDFLVSGRHNYGIWFLRSDYNNITNYNFNRTNLVAPGYHGDGHNDAIQISVTHGAPPGGSGSRNNRIINGTFRQLTTDYSIYLLHNSPNNYFENITIECATWAGTVCIRIDRSSNTTLKRIIAREGSIIITDDSDNTTIIDSTFNRSNPDIKDISVLSTSFSVGTVYLINTTFNDSQVDEGTVYRQWYLDVYVNDAYGNSIQNANISTWMNSGIQAFSELTGSNGYITQQTLTEYLHNSSGRFYNDYVNYTITTTKSGYDGDSIKVNLTQSKTEFVTLSSSSPYDNNPDQFWVRKDGNDACSGQNDLSYAEDPADCAWLTIQKAANTLTAGQTARVQAGHYGDETVVVTNSGTAGNRITFKADGNVTLESTYTNTRAFDLNSQDYITVDGFTILKYGTGIYYQNSDYAHIYNNLIGESSVFNGGNTGLGINNRYSDNTRIENNTVYNSGLYNIYVYVSDNVTLKNNVIYDNDTIEQTNPDTRSDYGFRLNNMTNSYSENNTVYNIGNDYVGHSWRLRHSTYNNTFVNDKAYNFVGYGLEFDDNASGNTFIDIILDGNNPDYPSAVNSGGWGSRGVAIKLRTHDNTFTNLTAKNLYNGVDIRASYHSASMWGYNVCVDESTGGYLGGYCNYESRNNKIINSTFENIENSAFRMYSPGNTMEGNRIVTDTTYDYYIEIGSESEIINPKDTSFTIKLGNETSALNITFTNGNIFSLDNNEPITAGLDNTAYYVSGITNKITVTKYNSTIHVTGGDIRVNSFSTSGMTLDYYNVALDYVNFTLADDVSAFDITLNNVPSGTTLTLKYANGTVIDTQTASGTVYFNDSLTDGGYYIEKEVVDTIPPTIPFFLPTPGDGSTVDSDYIYINVTLSEAPDWIALEWNGNNETMDGSGTNRYKNKTGLSNGTYSFKVFANDSAGNMNVSETRVVTIAYSPPPTDTTLPTIAIQSPNNDTYTNKIISLNYTADEALSTCFVSVDGTANATLPDCKNQSVISREYESTAGTMGWYHFNENGGSNVVDSSENGNNGAMNGALRTTGKFGSGLQFDGVDDYVAIPDDGSLNIDDSSFSITAWIYVSSTDRGFFISKGDEGGAGSVMHLGTNYDSNDDIDFHFWSDDLRASNAIPAYNEWFHVAFTYDAADNSRKIFVNAVQKASDITASNISNTDGEDLIFGKDQPADRHWEGKLDEVRMLNRTLTAEEIKAEYALGAGSHNITVYANDTSGNWNSTTRYFTVLQSHTLSEGWNTVNFTGYNNTSIESSLSAVDYAVIWGSTGGIWKAYIKGIGGDFDTLTSGNTYLIYANSNTTWTYPVS